MRLITLFCLLAAVSAKIGDEQELVEADTVDDFPLESPWGVAFDDDNVYFSNFGAPLSSVDWVGVVESGRAKKLYSLADVDDAVEIMHVKDIAVDDTGAVYLASYGGPASSHILKCDRKCDSIYEVGNSFMPTAIAYSTSLERLFIAYADGELEKSKIVSIDKDGKDFVTYAEQSDDTGLAFPVGLAIDDENKHIYWSNDAGPDQIQRGPLMKDSDEATDEADKIGTIMSDERSFHPHNIALDVKGQFIYFTDQTSEEHQIGRVTFRGEDASIMISLDESIPHGLALDVEKQKIYWAQTGTSTIMEGEIDDLGVAPKGVDSSVASFTISFCLLALSMLFAL